MLRLPKLPPTDIRGPRPTPILGALGNTLGFFRDPVSTLLSLHARYGVIATLADRDPAMICAFGGALNHAVLSDSRLFHHWSEIPVPVPPDSAPVRLNQSLISTNGETHRRNRRLVMPAFQKSGIERYLPDMIDITDRALTRLRPGETVDIDAVMTELTMHIVVRSLFGIEPQPGIEHVGSIARRYIEALISPAAIMFPYMLPGTPYRRFRDLGDRLEAALRELIARRRAQPGGSDVISTLIAAHDEDGGSLTDADLVGQAAVLFIAGHETTSFTLSWTLFLLSQHPRVLADLEDELRGALGGAPPTAAQIAAMPLLDAVIKESQRLFPATPFLFLRKSTGTFELGGHALPEGATVILSPLITHRIPSVFPDPQRFQPRRWEGRQPTLYEYLPFGAGPRMCIGAGFASQVLRVVLPMVLSRFRLSLAPGAQISRKVRGVTMGPRHGVPMRVGSRDDSPPTAVRVRGDIHELVELS